jgi:DNA repair exonuclease SbcCD ATPase subunit
MNEGRFRSSTVEVAVDPLTAFTAFTDELDLWWVRGPINAYDTGRLVEMRCEHGVGGRILEVYDAESGEEHELARFSGGEQDITNLCLRIAIAEWVAREREAEINFMVLDEVFGSQDDERRQLLLSELRALGNRFHQLLVITHVGEIADLCEHHVEVTLEETGRSTAAFVE